jgi:hypothetical protein
MSELFSFRAFIVCQYTGIKKVSAELDTDMQSGWRCSELFTLNRRLGPMSHKANPDTVRVSANGGLLGICLREGHWVNLGLVDTDAASSKDVDLDPMGLPLFTVPLINAQDELLAVLQLVPSAHSPPVSDTVDTTKDSSFQKSIEPEDEMITFQQAIQWLMHQLSQPLSHLLHLYGQSQARVQADLADAVAQADSPTFHMQQHHSPTYHRPGAIPVSLGAPNASIKSCVVTSPSAAAFDYDTGFQGSEGGDNNQRKAGSENSESMPLQELDKVLSDLKHKFSAAKVLYSLHSAFPADSLIPLFAELSNRSSSFSSTQP